MKIVVEESVDAVVGNKFAVGNGKVEEIGKRGELENGLVV